MTDFAYFRRAIENLSSGEFEPLALEIFRYQAEYNPVYRKYLSLLDCRPGSITQLAHVPFIPVEFFKYHQVKTGEWDPEIIYTSSGTTVSQVSQHFVPDRAYYLAHARSIFEANYGPLSNYHIFGLLPSYLERKGSSLIDMVEDFIQASGSEYSGLYLYNHDELREAMAASQSQPRKALLLGVSFALLDLAESGGLDSIPELTVMETGGMKGRRKEMIREELHEILCKALNVSAVHSEYGMTELMSQSYSYGQGIFTLPESMKIFLRDPNDPFDLNVNRKQGAINIVDLANVASCCFIQTSDVGERTANGFRIAGRMDNSDIRGCNLMVQSAL